MRSTIYYKFILGYFLFALLCIIFINTWATENSRQTIMDKYSDKLKNEGTAVLSEIETYSVFDIELKNKLDSFSDITNTRMCLVLNNEYIYDSAHSINNSSSKKTEKNPRKEFENKHISEIKNPTVYDGPIYGQKEKTYYSVIFPMNNMACLVISTDYSNITDEINLSMGEYYILFLAFFFFSLIILLLFTFAVYVPLRKISKAAREYAKGNFKYKGLEKFNNEDEIYKLGMSLNFMASKLSDIEDDQKKFLSNISHDFRSPLTSIKGYIEAMKDGTITPDIQDKYLDIVLFETNRLTNLTQNILTLNSWDDSPMHLTITEFNLYEMLKPITDSFEVKCKRKGITLDVSFSTKAYRVSGDKEKLQQVFYNLIDNAIKFSYENSTIWINISDKNDVIFVSIKDSGIGIPKEGVGKVFDRFYKTDLSRGKDKTGSGLGLSIVKEIIQAHKENINVISTEGVGTEFIFTLKRKK